MRILLVPLLAAAAFCLAAQQPSVPPAEALSQLYIPAQLNTTLKAEKAHVGDVVRFKTIEAVLLGKGVIMPANTKLYGRVLGAAARQEKEKKPSWISVVIERAEWKEHTVALRAFISSQVAASVASGPHADISVPNPNDYNKAIRANTRRRNTLQDDPRNTLATTRASDTAAWNNEINMQAPFLVDVKMARQKSGATVLFSEKQNLKLTGGLRFVLQNIPAETETTTTHQ
jgi:hypothetical protein